MKRIIDTRKAVLIITFLLLCTGLSVQNIVVAQELEEIEIVISCGITRSEGTESKSQSVNVKDTDIIQQVDDILIILRHGTLYTVSLSPDTNEPLELVSELPIPGYAKKIEAYHYHILANEKWVILLTEVEESFEFSFFSLNSYGELEYVKRYSFNADNHDVWEYLTTSTIVDNTLVFLGPSYIDFEDDSLLSFLSNGLEVKTTIPNSNEQKQEDIMLSRQWVNPIGAYEEWGIFTDVVMCPLDSFADDGLKCNITSLFGVSSDAFFINEQAVYLWGEHFIGGHYGVMGQSPEEYLERTDLELEVSYDETLSALYRIDLNYRDVTAVLIEGWLLNPGAFEESDGLLHALIKKEGDLDVNDDLVYGLSIGIDQFSDLPIALPESDYQFLAYGEGWINANRFSKDYVALSHSIDLSKENSRHELILWDIETEGVVSIESEFQIDGLFFYDDILLTVGRSENNNLKMQTWLLNDEVESLFATNFKQLFIDHKELDNYFLRSNYGQSVFGLPIKRINEGSNDVAQYVNSFGETEDINDVHYFEISDSGAIKPIGVVLSEPKIDIIEEAECEESCDDWYGFKRLFRVGNSVYSIIGDEILKGNFEAGEVTFASRFNLFLNENEK